MKMEKYLTHKDLPRLLKKLQGEECLKCGAPPCTHKDHWYDQEVTLEFPLGEICRDGITTLALVGLEKPETMGLTGKEGFNAQGLEGKIQVRKPMINALYNMRDILPLHRGRIVTR